MAEPPSLPGAVHERLIVVVPPDVAERPVGAPGTVGVAPAVLFVTYQRVNDTALLPISSLIGSSAGRPYPSDTVWPAATAVASVSVTVLPLTITVSTAPITVSSAARTSNLSMYGVDLMSRTLL